MGRVSSDRADGVNIETLKVCPCEGDGNFY